MVLQFQLLRYLICFVSILICHNSKVHTLLDTFDTYFVLIMIMGEFFFHNFLADQTDVLRLQDNLLNEVKETVK